MTTDISNTFVQTQLEHIDKKDRIIMKNLGVLVDILVNDSPVIYTGYVVYKNSKKLLYVEVLHAIYRMLISTVLWYKKFSCDLEAI